MKVITRTRAFNISKGHTLKILVKAYIKHFDTQEEAVRNIKNKMKLAYEAIKPSSKRGIGLGCNVTSLYA